VFVPERLPLAMGNFTSAEAYAPPAVDPVADRDDDIRVEREPMLRSSLTRPLAAGQPRSAQTT